MDSHLLDLILFSITSLGWLVAYIDAIRIGHRDKTYCVPFVAIALNITWETIGASWYIRNGSLNFFSFTYLLWGVLDVLILVTYFKYGYQDFFAAFGKNKRFFVRSSLFILLLAGMWQLVYCKTYSNDWLIDTSYNQNLLMSLLFVCMLWSRKSSRGQSMTIAIGKCVGTLGSTLQGYITMHNTFMAGMGTLCFIVDIIYIILLYRTIREEKAQALAPKKHSQRR